MRCWWMVKAHGKIIIHMLLPNHMAKAARGIFLQLAFVLVFIILWQVIVVVGKIPPYIMATPVQTGEALVEHAGFLLENSAVTLKETLFGFAIGLGVGLFVAFLVVYSEALDKFFSPLLIIAQTTPKIALAPLILLWFGHGTFSRALVAALMVFYVVTTNTVKGLKSTDRELLYLMRSYGASFSQTLRKVMFPSALPFIFVGLRIGVLLSLSGAVIAEILGFDKGMGYVVVAANSVLDIPLLFSALIVISIIGFLLHYSIIIMEKALLRWHVSQLGEENSETG